MTDVDRTSLDRILPATTSAPDWDDVMSRTRAHVVRRRRRVVALAAAALVAAGTASAFGSVRDLFRDVGFIGLPPQGATPSAMPTAPENGELVLFYWGPAAGNSDYGRQGVGKSRIWVYADGRLIFLREAAIPQGANPLFTGFLEQRLTPEGAELLRSETVSSGLLGGDQVPPVPFGTNIEVRNDDRLVRVERASDLERLVARLTDPASWLPASAWEDREIRAYVPSRYAVCYGGFPQPIEVSRVLSLLPTQAADLLRAKDLREEQGGDLCSDATTEEARALAETLDDGGAEQSGLGDGRGPARAFRLEYSFAVPGSPDESAHVFFEPYLPHGETTCSPCG
jgi:hypothetical protein